MLCDEVTALLPGMVDGDLDVDDDAVRHIETCLRCQAELARYRRLLRTLALLRSRYAEPTPGLLGETLAALTDAAEESARRTLLSGRRLAYAGAIGGTAVAAGATAALLIARSRKRSVRLAG
jgi:anti-sigma factor RsiW